MRVRTLLMIRTRQFPALNCSTPAARVSYALTAFSITVFGNRFKYSGARSAKLPRIKCLDVAILPLQKLFICRGDFPRIYRRPKEKLARPGGWFLPFPVS